MEEPDYGNPLSIYDAINNQTFPGPRTQEIASMIRMYRATIENDPHRIGKYFSVLGYAAAVHQRTTGDASFVNEVRSLAKILDEQGASAHKVLEDSIIKSCKAHLN